MANLQEELFNNILAICPTEADFENLLGLKVTIEVGHLLLLFTDTNPLCVVLVLMLQKTVPPQGKVEWWTLRHSRCRSQLLRLFCESFLLELQALLQG